MAELHRNQYPYAEEFVFLVTGGEVKQGSFDFDQLKSFFIVGRHEDTVKECWHELCHSKSGWAPLACLSMQQLGKFRQSLSDAAAKPESYTKIPCIDMASSSNMNKVPWIITIANETNAAPGTMVVIARTAEDVSDWAKKKNSPLVSVLNQAMIEGTWSEMTKVQNGRASSNYFAEEQQDVDEHYAELLDVRTGKLDELLAKASKY